MSEVFIVDEELQDIRIDKYLNEFLKDNIQNIYSETH